MFDLPLQWEEGSAQLVDEVIWKIFDDLSLVAEIGQIVLHRYIDCL